LKRRAQKRVSKEPFRFQRKPWCSKQPSLTFEWSLGWATNKNSIAILNSTYSQGWQLKQNSFLKDFEPGKYM
jgi:hypothetical protein